MTDKLLIIAGPTASGKTQIAMDIAIKEHLEIISADSMLVYKYMDIGTAKPSIEERKKVKHHLIDVAEPDSKYTVTDFCNDADKAIENIKTSGNDFLVCGGTGFYLNALINGTFDAPPSVPSIREDLESKAEDKEKLKLMHLELQKIDPESAARIHYNDKYRIVRALEVYRISGKTMSFYRNSHKDGLKPRAPLMIVLDPAKEVLVQNIKARTEKMLKAGLIEEVKGLISLGYGPELKPMKSIGYLQAVKLINGSISTEEAKEDIIKETVALAKRQVTWFKKRKDTIWFDPYSDIEKIKEETKRHLKL